MFRILSTYGACIFQEPIIFSFLHQGTVCYNSYDPWCFIDTGRQTVYIPSLPWLYSKSQKWDAVYRRYTAPFYGRSITVAVWLKESKQNSCPNKKVFQTTTSTSLNNPRSFVSRGRQLSWNRRWGTDGLWPGRRCLLGERYRGLAGHPSFFS